MFSKFDTNIQSDELAPLSLRADWEEYHVWRRSRRPPSLSLSLSFDPHRDYAKMEDEDPSSTEPWDDDYTDYDPVDMYAAEWENYAMRDWDGGSG